MSSMLPTSMLLFFVCLLTDQCFRSVALKVLGKDARLRQDPVENDDEHIQTNQVEEAQSFPKKISRSDIFGTSEHLKIDLCGTYCGMWNALVKSATDPSGYTYCEEIKKEENCGKAYLWKSSGGIVKPCHWNGDTCVTYNDGRDWAYSCHVDPAELCAQKNEDSQSAKIPEQEEVKSAETVEVGHDIGMQGNEAASVPSVREVKFVEVPLSTGAACLDGSPYVFAVTLGRPSQWTFHMDGRSCNSVESCARVSETSYGSSKIKIENYGRVSGCTCKNLREYEFHDDCTCVDLPICDGGFLSGYRKEPYETPEGKQIYSRGRRNLDAALDFLFNEYGLASAEEVIATGHSVGGTTTILTLDAMAARMPSGVKIGGMPTAGLTIDDSSFCDPGDDEWDCTFDTPHVKDSDTCCYTKFLEQVYNLHNMSAQLSKDCVAEYKDRPWTCLLGAHAASYTKTPMMILNSRYDAWQLVNILGLNHGDIYNKQAAAKEFLDPVKNYGDSFMRQLNQSFANTQHKAYITSCVCHAACGLDGSFFSNNYHGYWLGNIVGTWFEGYNFETYNVHSNVIVEEGAPNYMCDAEGVVQSVSDAWK